jgi:hypothetical protein
MMRRSFILVLLAFSASSRLPAQAPAPMGLAASAAVNPAYTWVKRFHMGFRAYFLADSYPAQHQDSLLARLPAAARHAERLLGLAPRPDTIDVFFVESREQMNGLVGFPVTGFADIEGRSVFLVTNPGWRAFERHEIMHIVSGQAWGARGPNVDWLLEGLAQAADGRCGGYSNAGVVLAMTARRGWVPFTDLVTRFREQPDLRAYLQAAAFVDYLLDHFFPSALEPLWRNGTTPESLVSGRPLSAIEAEWRAGLREPSQPGAAELAVIEDKGCG